MKSFDSRAYGINDFVDWEKQKQLILNPVFQRRAVWSEKAKSYLIDTILCGKPIPKVFIRQQLNVTTKISMKEVVDGQQRLRTILSYIKDGFMVNKRQNATYGGKFFSQLPEEVQAQFLTYEIAVDLLTNMPDAEILDIFSRLNSYAIVLNEQERINATHFSSFKMLADSIGRKYYEYWLQHEIITAKNILRMQEVNLVADILIAMREGIKSKKQIKKYYDVYEEKFDDDISTVEKKFDDVVAKIGELYPEGLANTEFSRPHIYYSLFTAVAHCLYGISGLPDKKPLLKSESAVETARNGLDRVGEIFEVKDFNKTLLPEEQQFIQDSRRATTDEKVRKRRTEYLLGLMAP